jgi:tripartite-type tricarboxylate transporter receptor subunit TctC
MNLARRRFWHLAAGASVLVAIRHVAWAQAYPSRPITISEPFAAGGPLDTIGRIIAERMQVSLGQPVIIENVPGASGTLGSAVCHARWLHH